jgi:UPF0716 protein FxsA
VFAKLAILFITIPICEIFIFLEAGQLIGLWPTLLTVVFTGIAGAYLARTQGFDLLQRIQATLNRNELPASELLDGAFILAGGMLLLTPGFLTDLCGFLFLTPFSRIPLKRLLSDWIKKKIEKGEIVIGQM